MSHLGPGDCSLKSDVEFHLRDPLRLRLLMLPDMTALLDCGVPEGVPGGAATDDDDDGVPGGGGGPMTAAPLIGAVEERECACACGWCPCACAWCLPAWCACACVGDGEDGEGLIELEEWPSECSEPVDWYMLATERLETKTKKQNKKNHHRRFGFPIISHLIHRVGCNCATKSEDSNEGVRSNKEEFMAAVIFFFKLFLGKDAWC